MVHRPPRDVAIDCTLVRALLEEQHPDLAHLPLIEIGEGWDNCLFRLGTDLAVRLPRREASAILIAHEQRWLPSLGARLPLPVPVPHRIGRPCDRFPWSWSVTPWFPGHPALRAAPHNAGETAVALGQVLRALHEPAPADAPANAFRGIPVTARTKSLSEHLRHLDGLLDRAAVLGLWARVQSTPSWPGPPLWIHGDLHPGNLLVSHDRLSAVIDFGDLTAGDPATDLSVAWMLLPPPARSAFRAASRGRWNPVDDHTWMRARGWALALGIAFMAHARDDPALAALGVATVTAALHDDS